MLVGDLFTFLSENAGVAAIVATRIYPSDLVQGSTLPAIVYSQMPGPTHVTLDAKPYDEEHFRFSCIAGNFDDAKNLAIAVKAALTAYAGEIGGTNAHGVFPLGERDLYNPDTLQWRTDVDFKILHG